MRSKIVVVGAGAAGIIAAWRAAELGAEVTLLEKNDRVGIKILISGGGKCNITQAGTVEHVLSGFRRNEALFLRPSLYRFPNSAVVDMLTRRGLDVYTRPDGRVFPVDKNAKDVVAILRRYLEGAGVKVRLQAAVTDLETDQSGIAGVRIGDTSISSRHVIIATGGCSYPATGTTGDGWKWPSKLGHTIIKVRAALAPIITKPGPPADWAGVALRECLVRARQDGKEFARWTGDLLFTHRGVSGPSALGISRDVAERRECGSVQLEVDLLPGKSYEDAADQVRRFTQDQPKRRIAHYVADIVPTRLTEALLESAGLDRSITGAHLTLKQRSRLVETLKGWQIGEALTVPIEKGEVTAGGISLDEVESQSMRSRKIEGLYLCGEVLDIAGPVGGYNLQAAFSTGYIAGESAAQDALAQNG